MKKENFWSQYAEDFDELNDYIIGEEDMKIVKKRVGNIEKTGHLLEIACGSGIYTNLLKNRADHVLATDLSEKMIEKVQERFSSVDNVEVERADGQQLHYPKETFDMVFIGNFIHVTDNYHQLMEQAVKVLKPGGRLCALDFTAAGMTPINVIKLVYRYKKSYGGPTTKAEKNKFNPEEMKKLFENHGLEVLECDLIGDKTKAVFCLGEKIKKDIDKE